MAHVGGEATQEQKSADARRLRMVLPEGRQLVDDLSAVGPTGARLEFRLEPARQVTESNP